MQVELTEIEVDALYSAADAGSAATLYWPMNKREAYLRGLRELAHAMQRAAEREKIRT